jgi:sRNA-binding carbon storage regulator CsrA
MEQTSVQLSDGSSISSGIRPRHETTLEANKIRFIATPAHNATLLSRRAVEGLSYVDNRVNDVENTLVRQTSTVSDIQGRLTALELRPPAPPSIQVTREDVREELRKELQQLLPPAPPSIQLTREDVLEELRKELQQREDMERGYEERLRRLEVSSLYLLSVTFADLL